MTYNLESRGQGYRARQVDEAEALPRVGESVMVDGDTFIVLMVHHGIAGAVALCSERMPDYGRYRAGKCFEKGKVLP